MGACWVYLKRTVKKNSETHVKKRQAQDEEFQDPHQADQKEPQLASRAISMTIISGDGQSQVPSLAPVCNRIQVSVEQSDVQGWFVANRLGINNRGHLGDQSERANFENVNEYNDPNEQKMIFNYKSKQLKIEVNNLPDHTSGLASPVAIVSMMNHDEFEAQDNQVLLEDNQARRNQILLFPPPKASRFIEPISANPIRIILEKQEKLIHKLDNPNARIPLAEISEFNKNSGWREEDNSDQSGDGSQDKQSSSSDGSESQSNLSEEENEDESEEEQSHDTEEDLFSSKGILYEITKENQKKKQILGLDQYDGKTYIIKQYPQEQALELNLNRELALKVYRLQKNHLCLCQIKAIKVSTEEGVNVIQHHEQGGSLEIFLDNPFTEKDAKLWLMKILEAVKILHDNNIVHGNLKPNNILIGSGNIKLTDINIFKNTKYLHNLYSAPEVLLQDRLSEKADIWSIGLIFIQVCWKSGVMPFLQKYPNLTVSQLRKKIKGTRLQFHSFSTEIQDFIQSMYAVNPDRRSTARELLQSSYLRSIQSINEKPSKKELRKQLTMSIEQKTGLKRMMLTKNLDALNNSHQLHSDMHYFQDNHSVMNRTAFSKLNSTFADKQIDKSLKYGQTSLLSYYSIVNIKDKEYLHQESYLPISMSNLLMNTYKTIDGIGGGLVNDKNSKPKDLMSSHSPRNRDSHLSERKKNYESALNDCNQILNQNKSKGENGLSLTSYSSSNSKHVSNKIQSAQNAEGSDDPRKIQVSIEGGISERERQKLEIEKNLMDILNGQIEGGSDASFQQMNSSRNSHYLNKMGSHIVESQAVYRTQQQPSDNQDLLTKEQDILEQMQRILEDNSQAMSNESVDQRKAASVKEQNSNTFKNIMTQSSYQQKTSNSVKTNNNNNLNNTNSKLGGNNNSSNGGGGGTSVAYGNNFMQTLNLVSSVNQPHRIMHINQKEGHLITISPFNPGMQFLANNSSALNNFTRSITNTHSRHPIINQSLLQNEEYDDDKRTRIFRFGDEPTASGLSDSRLLQSRGEIQEQKEIPKEDEQQSNQDKSEKFDEKEDRYLGEGICSSPLLIETPFQSIAFQSKQQLDEMNAESSNSLKFKVNKFEDKEFPYGTNRFESVPQSILSLKDQSNRESILLNEDYNGK